MQPPVSTQGFSFLGMGYIFTTDFSIFLTEHFTYNNTNQTSEIVSHLLAGIQSTGSNAVDTTSGLEATLTG